MSSTKDPGRFAGVLYLLTSIVGFFAMGYVPGKLIVHSNAAATANNIAASETLFRLGIAGELIGQAGFIFVALALYDLLRGVNRRRASLMVILIVVSIPIAFLNELNAIAALVLVRGADFLSLFDEPQRDETRRRLSISSPRNKGGSYGRPGKRLQCDANAGVGK